MEDIKIIYNSFEKKVLINYFTSNIFHDDMAGTFLIENDTLKIKWNLSENEEIFKKIDKIHEDELTTYIITNKNKTNVNNMNVNNVNNVININGKVLILDFNINKVNYENTIEKYNFEIIEDNIMKIKFKHYYQIFKLKKNIYYDITEEYNKIIDIVHESWNDKCVINEMNNFIYRYNINEEYGIFKIENSILTIYWDKWDPEEFEKKDNVYYLKKNSNKVIDDIIVEDCEKLTHIPELQEFNYKDLVDDEDVIYQKNLIEEKKFADTNTDKNISYEIQVYHNSWNDICKINNNSITRASNIEDTGKFILENNKLIILWDKWESEVFYRLDNIYYYEKFIKIIYIEYEKIFLNEFDNKIYNSSLKYSGIVNFDENIAFVDFNGTKEPYFKKIEDNNSINLYKQREIEIILVKKFEETVIIDLFNEKIYTKDLSKKGIYIIKDNKIKIYWDSFFYDETYELINNKYYYDLYLELNDKDFLLINDSLTEHYKLNFFEHYLYNDNEKLYFLENNNIYYIIQNDILNTYNLNIKNDQYQLLNNKNNLSLKNNINFLHNTINNFMNNNVKSSTEIIYNNFKDNSEFTYIINLDNNKHINDLLKYIYRKASLIINIKMNNNENLENIDNLEDTLQNLLLYDNLVIMQSKNVDNYSILEYITENILKKGIHKNIRYLSNYSLEVLIDLYYCNFDSEILLYKNDTKCLFNYFNDYNYLFDLVKYCESKNDIIMILIFYVILKETIYTMADYNFFTTHQILNRIILNKFSKEIIMLFMDI